jgi:hypothetical protein
MTVPQEDLDRFKDEYADTDSATSLDDIRDDLESAGFDGNSLDAISEGLAADSDVARSERALRQAQRQAVDTLGDGGAVGGQVVRAETDGSNPPKTIGKAENVEQEIKRVGPTTGEVVATNKNTGTSGVIGEVDLANPTTAIEQ